VVIYFGHGRVKAVADALLEAVEDSPLVFE
jgi:hypothetical protein